MFSIESIDFVKLAFRKLKAHVYFDKTALPLRDEVVAFEAREDFERQLRRIADAYDENELNIYNSLFNSIINSIGVLSFPKKMKESKSSSNKKDNTVISVGNPKDEPIIEKLQHFIDMNVEGHILGIMWILQFGKSIDESCYDKARGNRLRCGLVWTEEDVPKNNPALFEPYFEQYSKWRDEGLSCAEALLSNGQDVLILTLDLKSFYYQAGITKEVFDNLLDSDILEKNIGLHNAVFAILKKYTEVLGEKEIKHNGIALPIGFLPSAVLSNWCLKKFDNGILDFWNPSYYARYVDDLIIVEKIEKRSEIYKRARENNLTKDFIIDYYMGNGRRETSTRFAYKKTEENYTSFSKSHKSKQHIFNNDEIVYSVATPFSLSEESSFQFQQDKTRILALFAENNSTALIDKFKKEIIANVSEFHLMPDMSDGFSQENFSDFYKLDNDATINKLRGVSNISLEKYELSKFLGRYRVVSSLVDDIIRTIKS